MAGCNTLKYLTATYKQPQNDTKSADKKVKTSYNYSEQDGLE